MKIYIRRYLGSLIVILTLTFAMGCEKSLGGDFKLKGESISFIQVDETNFDDKKYYMNTKNRILAADPFVIDGGDGYYYAYATSDKLSGYGFLVWKSKDLVHWEEVGISYYVSKDSWGVKDFWAPEVTKYNNKFYMHYTAKDKDGKIKIGMAISETPEGPFIDVSEEPFFYPGYNVIDSNILIDDDGQIYMYYSRDCSEHVVEGRNESHIYVVKVKNMEKVISEPIKLIAPELPWEIVSGNYRWNEGPEILKYENKYYLIYSANFYNSRQYALGYAVADSPLGPFEKVENNQILYVEEDWNHVSGTGHNSFATSPDGEELYTVYHSHINPEGGGPRQINTDKVGFREDKTMYVNGPSVSPQPLPSGGATTVKLDPFIESIKVNGEETIDTKLLIDGEVVYHSKNQEREWEGYGTTQLSIQFAQDVKLTDILIYGNNHAMFQPVITSIQLSEESYISNINSSKPKLPGEALILSFDEVVTDTITISIENNGEFRISELNFLGVDSSGVE